MDPRVLIQNLFSIFEYILILSGWSIKNNWGKAIFGWKDGKEQDWEVNSPGSKMAKFLHTEGKHAKNLGKNFARAAIRMSQTTFSTSHDWLLPEKFTHTCTYIHTKKLLIVLA